MARFCARELDVETSLEKWLSLLVLHGSFCHDLQVSATSGAPAVLSLTRGLPTVRAVEKGNVGYAEHS